MPLPTGKPHVSFSEIRDWSECSYRHKLRHVDKIDLYSRPSPFLEFGTAVHACCEFFLKTRVVDMSIVRTILEEAWKKYGNEPEFKDDTVEGLLEMASQIMSDVPKFLDDTFPGWQCREAEEQLYEPVPPHPAVLVAHDDVSFKGFVDAVLEVDVKKGDKTKKMYWLLDWKTTVWGWNKYKRQDFMVMSQLILYKTVWAKKHDIPMSDIKCGFVLLKKTAKTGEHCELIPVSVGPTTSGRSLKILNNMVSAVKKGTAIKNKSSCTYCEYYRTPHCTM